MDNIEIFNTTLSTYSALIWSMCRNAACGDSELCRDLFQEASIRLWQHISELDMNAKPYQQKAWVEWQVRHVLSHIRKPREMEHNLLTCPTTTQPPRPNGAPLSPT